MRPGFFLCAPGTGALLGSASLPWAASGGTTQLSQGVCREAESEGADAEIRTRRTETGYEAYALGNVAMDTEAQFSTTKRGSASCSDLRKRVRLYPGRSQRPSEIGLIAVAILDDEC